MSLTWTINSSPVIIRQSHSTLNTHRVYTTAHSHRYSRSNAQLVTAHKQSSFTTRTMISVLQWNFAIINKFAEQVSQEKARHCLQVSNFVFHFQTKQLPLPHERPEVMLHTDMSDKVKFSFKLLMTASVACICLAWNWSAVSDFIPDSLIPQFIPMKSAGKHRCVSIALI